LRLFKDLIYEQLVCEITYSIEDYLTLLKTYSVYIALDDEKRNYLLANLRELLENNCGNSIQASYLSAFHVAQKTSAFSLLFLREKRANAPANAPRSGSLKKT